jgi:beta-lactamase regulating signal transducer with metallopeptidase domain
MSAQLTAWLLTYAVHSTLLLGLAWAVSRVLARRSLRLEERVWRAALLGALATATLQTAAGWAPPGSWSLAGRPAPAPQVAAAPAPLSAAASASPAAVLQEDRFFAPSNRPAAAPARPAVSGSALLLAAWGLGAGVLLARLALAHRGLSRRLRVRLEISGGTLSRLLSRLAPQSGLVRPVRLTCSHLLPVPIALGVRRPEICVPPRALSHLEPAAQETLLAHELGHLARRDPLWLTGVHLLAAVLFFQPLNWVARRRLREISELLCDEWAVRRTGQPLTLARCLAEVAGWSLGGALGQHSLLPAPGMADRPSQLAHRVRRLLDGLPAGEPALPRWTAVVLGTLLLGVAAIAPGVSAAGEKVAPPTPSAPEAAEAPEAPDPPELPDPPAPPAALPALAPAGRGLTAADRRRLDEFRARAEALAARSELSEEDAQRLAADADRLAAEIQAQIAPRLVELTARLQNLHLDEAALARLEAETEALAELEPAADELSRLAEELAEIAIDALPSEAELERIAAEALRAAEASLPSDAELERISAEALRAAEAQHLSPEAQDRIRRSADQHREEMRKLEAEHRKEMETLRRQLIERSRAIGDEVRRSLERDLRQDPPAPPAPPAAPIPTAPPAAAPPAPPAAPAAAPAPAARPARRSSLRPAPAPAAPMAPRAVASAPPTPRPTAAPVPASTPTPRPVLAPAPAARPALAPAPPAPAPPVRTGRRTGPISGGVVGGVEEGVQGGVEGGIRETPPVR